jgi:23S rRNA pseudouridine955/2504/2580 synthase
MASVSLGVETRVVTGDEAELRLDRWFRRHYPNLPQSAIQKLCRTGQIRLDGKRAETSDRLSEGQSIRVPPLPQVGPPLATKTPPPVRASDPVISAAAERMVLYRDDQLLVLNKPFGLAVQGGPGIKRHLDGMLDYLRFGSSDRPRLVHRLDRDTSGVIVVARTPGVAARIAASFRGRDVEKVYWAVVAGRPVPVEGRIELDLVRHGNAHGALVVEAEPDDDDAAHSITTYRTLDHAGRKLAWLELRPLTGRTHQLRVHCASLGTPILGDVKYGATRNTDARGERNTAVVEGEGLGAGLHLHAQRISLPHPAGGRLSVEAALPAHMQATFDTLGFSAPAPSRPART